MLWVLIRSASISVKLILVGKVDFDHSLVGGHLIEFDNSTVLSYTLQIPYPVVLEGSVP